MESPGRKASPSAEVLFRDGFGDRVLFRDGQGRALQETLILTRDLSEVRTFEFSLSQRLAELEAFDHPSFARIRDVVRMSGPSPHLTIASYHTRGSRLSAILHAVEQKGASNPVDVTLSVVRQILQAMAAFHRHAAEMTHGALGPERIVLAEGKVLITDYILAPAIEQLRFSSERYWKELRVAVAPVPGAIRFDARVDVAQVALVALALFSGRMLREDEGLINLDESRVVPSLPRPIRSWLVRALHVDPRHGLFTMADALKAFDEAVAESKATTQSRGPTVKPALRPVTPPPQPRRPTPIVPKLAPKFAPPIQPKTQTMFQPAARATQAWSIAGGQTSRLKTFITIAAFAAVIAGAFSLARFVPPPALLSREGTLAVESNPKGMELFVDGRAVGLTPLTVTLKSGQHEIELRSGDRARAFNVSIVSGTHVSQYVEMFPTKK
jgi:PEGA domain